ncbi:zinc finger FYVE domain-containing protein 1-like isoform X2 [Babylonia areolata]|uniref:zinc finger FYVE domain-containing protein 1-like isoform X2 n=1 Tax=Babylonia areolata TaxID=304850 RepID=UPI003FD46585
MMRQQPKRRVKCRTSRQYCQEKLCCPNPSTVAAYFCKECNSAQCQECDKDIHSRKVSFEFHDRRTIEPPPDSLLCQAGRVNIVCKNRNFADVWCENCHHTFCFDCYSDYHHNRKQQHVNISFAHYQKRERERAAQDAAAATQLAIKPMSPVGDGTLTFCSFPQNSPSEETLPTRESGFDTAIMTMASTHSIGSSGNSMPDLCPGPDMNLMGRELEGVDINDDSVDGPRAKSFLLVNDKEELQVKDEETFVQQLGCSEDAKVKILSIFGNTGDGKSHTLNQTFYNGREMFQTSASQNSCTVGVWAAFDHQNNVITVDTEGLLGSSANDNKRTRLLLKILAISDIVVFRTRAERLHKDMFVFLSNASKAYKKHFSEELRAASHRFQIKESSLGPTLIVFQETMHTAPLKSDPNRSADAMLRDMFVKNKFEIEAFSEICYVGIKTEQLPTNFQIFRNVVLTKLKDHSIRAARHPAVMFQSLKALNRKFSGNIEHVKEDTFPEQYFTCTATCQACQTRCVLTMNHDTEKSPHDAGRGVNCRFEDQLGNKIYLCKKCSMSGRRNVVVPKTSESNANTFLGFTSYLVSGYVMECNTCGVIYRSRKHWYGNPDPESVVIVEVQHIWPEGHRSLQGTHNAARKLVDGFSYVADTISSVSARPAKLLSECIADQIAPSYWVPNSQIMSCKGCELVFTTNEQKHHCRACGQGFCDECSSKKRPVPERGWKDEPVRVCDACFAGHEMSDKETTLTARKVGEAVTSTFGVLASALDYPRSVLKDSARPEYWVPDEQIKVCTVCQQEFNIKRPIHHCRACGQGVCDECSPGRREVPLRGWDYPVRVCSKCENKTEEF